MDQTFWQNFLNAVEATPQPQKTIRGASGIVHSFVEVGVDEDRRRIVLISGEHDARTAALTQVDIQAALEKTRVLVARPLALNLSQLAQSLMLLLGRSAITSQDFANLPTNNEAVNAVIETVLKPSLAPLDFVSKIPLNAVAQFMQSIQQLARVSFTLEEPDDPSKRRMIIDFSKLAEMDPVEHDNFYGICPVPLYAFSATEVDSMNDSANLDDIRELLSRHRLLQYFFPAPDELALGLVDRGDASSSPTSILDHLNLAPEIGHPYGPMSLVRQGTKVGELIDALQERRMVIEGELGLEVGPDGTTIRQSLKFKPQEGLLSKLINRFTVNLDLKDWFKH
jgi:hypothetical protein